jgi:calcineurin-like phosphoesterase family protein
MPNVFLISDTHFGHANICKFLRTDGTKLRHWDDVDEMDKALINNWNNVVGVNDKVYHLGDVFINRKHRFILNHLNGKKVLIKGNHDIFDLENYTPFFKDIRAYHKLDKCILSHIPIHPRQLGRFKGNIHGHLHEHIVSDSQGKPDPRYMTVCVEHINYTPIELSVALRHFDQVEINEM